MKLNLIDDFNREVLTIAIDTSLTSQRIIRELDKLIEFQNGYIERFNKTYREEVLDNYSFDSLKQARVLTQAWMWIYKNERPHSSLGYQTPTQLLLKYGKLHHPKREAVEFPTFQRDSNYNWKFILLGDNN